MAGIKYPDNRLRELRTARGLSLRNLSEKTGIDFATISYCEKGQRNFSASSLKALADFFGVSVDYLLGTSAKEMLDGFVDSIRKDFTETALDSVGDAYVKYKGIDRPLALKFSVIEVLRELNDVAALDEILRLAKLKQAQEEFDTKHTEG